MALKADIVIINTDHIDTEELNAIREFHEETKAEDDTEQIFEQRYL